MSPTTFEDIAAALAEVDRLRARVAELEAELAAVLDMGNTLYPVATEALGALKAYRDRVGELGCEPWIDLSLIVRLEAELDGILSSRPSDPRSIPADIRAKLVALRDALASRDIEEAFHQLYAIVNPTFTSYTPWEDLEAPPAPPWTTEKPKEPGWYWLRLRDGWRGDEAQVVYIRQDESGYLFFGWNLLPDEAEWAGPLPEPGSSRPAAGEKGGDL